MEKIGKHLGTKTHTHKYHCESCDYHTSHKASMNRHLTTAKHKKEISGKILGTKRYECPFCSKIFKGYSGRWKHEKKCSNNPKIVIKRSEELEKKLEEPNKKIKNLEKKHVETLEGRLQDAHRHIEDL